MCACDRGALVLDGNQRQGIEREGSRDIKGLGRAPKRPPLHPVPFNQAHSRGCCTYTHTHTHACKRRSSLTHRRIFKRTSLDSHLPIFDSLSQSICIRHQFIFFVFFFLQWDGEGRGEGGYEELPWRPNNIFPQVILLCNWPFVEQRDYRYHMFRGTAL